MRWRCLVPAGALAHAAGRGGAGASRRRLPHCPRLPSPAPARHERRARRHRLQRHDHRAAISRSFLPTASASCWKTCPAWWSPSTRRGQGPPYLLRGFNSTTAPTSPSLDGMPENLHERPRAGLFRHELHHRRGDQQPPTSARGPITATWAISTPRARCSIDYVEHPAARSRLGQRRHARRLSRLRRGVAALGRRQSPGRDRIRPCRRAVA